jgi:hypothetical protein
MKNALNSAGVVFTFFSGLSLYFNSQLHDKVNHLALSPQNAANFKNIFSFYDKIPINLGLGAGSLFLVALFFKSDKSE